MIPPVRPTTDTKPLAGRWHTLGELVDRVPEGWTSVMYGGRRYGLSRTSRAAGRSISVYAEELAGTDVVSANVYRTSRDSLLRPCEMPATTVLAFLRGWTKCQPATAAQATPDPLPKREPGQDTGPAVTRG